MFIAFLIVLIAQPVAAVADGNWSYQYSCDQTPDPGYAACLGIRAIPSTNDVAGPAAAQFHLQATPASYSSTPVSGALAPADLHSAYQLPTDTSSASSQTVAIIDAYDDPTAEADLAVYSNRYGLPACTTANGCFTKINQNGGSTMPTVNGSWAGEISLDVQMVHAICQSCKILLVEAASNTLADLGAAVNEAASSGATEISNSYGSAESSSLLHDTHYDHPGIVITASAGDNGYLDKQASSGGGLPEYPASSPYVLSVGGTSLTQNTGVWHSSVWSDSGGGCSTVFSVPAWQSQADGYSGLGCGKRSDNDVAVIGNPATGVSIYDSTPDGTDPTGWIMYGGTSAGAPIIAAEYGLAGGSGGVAFPAATLYSHQADTTAFYDVISGSNDPSCAGNQCRAGIGFDGPTGLGSPLGISALTVDPSNAPGVVAKPTINGSPVVGSTLSAGHGSYSGAGPFYYTDAWERCDPTGEACQSIIGADGSTYTPGTGDVGSTLIYMETAYGSGGSITDSSLPTAVITEQQAVTPPVTVQPGAAGTASPAPVVKQPSSMTSSLKLISKQLREYKGKIKVRLYCHGSMDCSGNISLAASRHGRYLTRTQHYRIPSGKAQAISLTLNHAGLRFAQTRLGTTGRGLRGKPRAGVRGKAQVWLTVGNSLFRVSLSSINGHAAR